MSDSIKDRLVREARMLEIIDQRRAVEGPGVAVVMEAAIVGRHLRELEALAVRPQLEALDSQWGRA